MPFLSLSPGHLETYAQPSRPSLGVTSCHRSGPSRPTSPLPWHSHYTSLSLHHNSGSLCLSHWPVTFLRTEIVPSVAPCRVWPTWSGLCPCLWSHLMPALHPPSLWPFWNFLISSYMVCSLPLQSFGPYCHLHWGSALPLPFCSANTCLSLGLTSAGKLFTSPD